MKRMAGIHRMRKLTGKAAVCAAAICGAAFGAFLLGGLGTEESLFITGMLLSWWPSDRPLAAILPLVLGAALGVGL